MASAQRTADYILEQIVGAGQVSVRKMFGEYAVYCDGKVVALICKDQLYVKPTGAGRALLGEPVEGRPYPKAKPHFLIEGERWDDAEAMSALIRATAGEVVAKVKKPRARR